jgi:hypothetical protein
MRTDKTKIVTSAARILYFILPFWRAFDCSQHYVCVAKESFDPLSRFLYRKTHLLISCVEAFTLPEAATVDKEIGGFLIPKNVGLQPLNLFTP